MITIVNMMPQSMSGESNQDSEPNLAVNPANPKQIVATAFTPAPLGGADAPVYVSADSGNNWVLNAIVPGNGSFGTGDITTAFPTTGGVLYAGTLNGVTTELNILRTADPTANTPMTGSTANVLNLMMMFPLGVRAEAVQGASLLRPPVVQQV